MEEENLTIETQAQDAGSTSGAGDTAVTHSESLTLEEINAITGMSYKSKDSALKSIKDMKSMAGKAADLSGRPVEKQEDVAARIKALELDAFYARNPQHETNREILEALAETHGVSVKEATDLPAYKRIATAVEPREPRTVADSNNRVSPAPSSKEELASVIGDADKMAEYVTNKFILNK